MKFIKSIIIALSVLLAFTRCDAFKSITSTKVTAQGAPYELIVVCNQPEWESELGDSLRTILGGDIPYLSQQEPYYTILRVTVNDYKDLIARHRNILEVNINPSFKESSVAVRYDVTSTPQVVLTLQAPSVESATEYVSTNRESLIQVIEMAERDRTVDFAARFGVKSLEKLILDKFGVELPIPEGYTLRNEGDDFMWISHEYPVASQGVILYSYPADKGISSLSRENLLAARNKFVSRIPGPSDGSYMITTEEIPILTEEDNTTKITYKPIEQLYETMRIKGRLWAEMRGNWDVANDYMGGPYVSYSTIGEQSNRVFTIDCYVHSPKYGKRNYLRAVEHLVYGASFPKTEK